jgi:hypothetical protein
MSGGGGGANKTNASGPPTNSIRSYGGSGAYPLLTFGIGNNPDAPGFTTYGAGGGGSNGGPWGQVGYRNLLVDYSDRGDSNSSAGRGGMANAPATNATAGSGSGGGGGAFEEFSPYFFPPSLKGGNGGSGVVSIAYFQKPVISGPSTVSTNFGVAGTSGTFSGVGGNNAVSQGTPPGASVTYAWTVKDASGNAIPGVTINSSGIVSVAATTPVGSYSAVVRGTDPIGSYGTANLTVTVNRGAQSSLSFTSTAPVNHHVGGTGYVVTVAGGSGTGTTSVRFDGHLPEHR